MDGCCWKGRFLEITSFQNLTLNLHQKHSGSDHFFCLQKPQYVSYEVQNEVVASSNPLLSSVWRFRDFVHILYWAVFHGKQHFWQQKHFFTWNLGFFEKSEFLPDFGRDKFRRDSICRKKYGSLLSEILGGGIYALGLDFCLIWNLCDAYSWQERPYGSVHVCVI